MEMVKVEVDIPKDTYSAMKVMGFSTKEMIVQELKEATAIDLFKKKIFSLGKAAQLAGMPQADFRGLLRKNQIPAFEYTEEDWEQDKRSIGKYMENLKIVKVVSNASALISLGMIGQLDLLKEPFGKVCIPEAVYQEVVVKLLKNGLKSYLQKTNWQ